MIDSRQEVESHLYRKVVGKKHTWYVPATEYAAEGVHLAAGDGYGGAVVKFRLLDGSVDQVKGPWRMRHADPLFEDTGWDVREKYWTWVVINNRLHDDRSYLPGGYDRYLDVLTSFWAEHPEIGRTLGRPHRQRKWCQ